MLQELKAFLLRGNIVELAIALIIGLAFAAIITAFVEGIVNPLIALIVGQPDINNVVLTISGTDFLVGSVLGAIINFVLVGIVLFFLMKAATRTMASMEADKEEEVVIAEPSEDVVLLRQIRDSLAAVPGPM